MNTQLHICLPRHLLLSPGIPPSTFPPRLDPAKATASPRKPNNRRGLTVRGEGPVSCTFKPVWTSPELKNDNNNKKCVRSSLKFVVCSPGGIHMTTPPPGLSPGSRARTPPSRFRASSATTPPRSSSSMHSWGRTSRRPPPGVGAATTTAKPPGEERTATRTTDSPTPGERTPW